MTWVAWDEESYLELVRRACFICEMLAGNPDYPHHVAHRDERAVVFLSKFPFMWGHVLVAPVEHREHVIGDFPLDDYLALRRVVHAAGTALTSIVPTERLYLLSLGSQQGNRHTHWHLAPLPPGVPYEQQQFAAFSAEGAPTTSPTATSRTWPRNSEDGCAGSS
ncbi:HIT family protein [Saccharothrix sp. ALI-22-I]|uniref:HIT family protein n=1 Tax=Saccharothrix sp. ALI-22-I TaxID=1933778 RepID=UPI000A07A41F|nr:HIT family protein [Saccharothrix sp. ALI-22-I]